MVPQGHTSSTSEQKLFRSAPTSTQKTKYTHARKHMSPHGHFLCSRYVGQQTLTSAAPISKSIRSLFCLKINMTNEERAKKILSSLNGPVSQSMHDIFFGFSGTDIDSQIISQQLHQPSGELRPDLSPIESQRARVVAIEKELSKDPELKSLLHLQFRGHILSDGLGL